MNINEICNDKLNQSIKLTNLIYLHNKRTIDGCSAPPASFPVNTINHCIGSTRIPYLYEKKNQFHYTGLFNTMLPHKWECFWPYRAVLEEKFKKNYNRFYGLAELVIIRVVQ